MKIRRATIADEPALSEIRRRAILELAGPVTSMDAAAKWAAGMAPDRIARAIREHQVWVAIEEAAIAWVEVDGDRIAAVYVSPAFASRGVGSQLLSLAETEIRNAGYEVARLEASPNAVEFYLFRGYSDAGPQLPDGSLPLSKNLSTQS